jgi:hypothetical protein
MIHRVALLACAALLAPLGAPAPAAAQLPVDAVAATAPAATAPPAADPPPAAAAASAADPALGPVPPDTVARAADGRVRIRAVRLERPLTLDGRLDEAIYEEVPGVDGFLQQVPKEGAPTTEKSEAWILYDDTNFYFSARLHDSHPERITANEMRRDSSNIFNGGDSITLVLDTMKDLRNGFLFQTNPLGALREQAIADGTYIESWNTIWQVRSARFDGGWSTEMMIPFKSLRYRESGAQTWGINFRRVIRWKNEWAGVTAMPAAFGPSGLAQMQVAADLVGLVTPARSRNIEVKPYVVSAATTDNTAAEPFSNRVTGNVGGDFKYGLSRSLISDVTINTDFAQIEEDVQQINLTRFNVLFPEKRDFFLEGQGIYAFGGRSLAGRGGGGDTDDVPVMFFSRQIGLTAGQTIPVIAGGRVAGKAGRYDLAALNISTDDKASAGIPTTNFTAARVRRDILRRSNIGAIATLRSPSGDQPSTAMFGADASFRLSQNTTALGYYVRADTPDGSASEPSYRARFDYAGDRYGLVSEHLLVGRQFLPSVGYTRREDLRRNMLSARFSPRLRNHPTMRKLTWQATVTNDQNAAATRLMNRSLEGSFGIEFHSGDQAALAYSDDYEYLPAPFRIAPDVTVPLGSYDNHTLSASYSLANQRRVAGRLSFATGALYDGKRHEAGYSGRVTFLPQFAIEPGISLAWVNIPYGDFAARLITNRFTYTPTARFLVSSLLQLNVDSHTFSASVRLRWEYRLGSEFFIVYSDGRDVTGPANRLLNRSLAVKATRLVRF